MFIRIFDGLFGDNIDTSKRDNLTILYFYNLTTLHDFEAIKYKLLKCI